MSIRTKSRWYNMMHRCYNPKHEDFPNYGGRGIKVCDRWWNMGAFLEDMENEEVGAMIERVDNDGDYCPENCRYVTNFGQQRNKRNTRLISHNGETLCSADLAIKHGVYPQLFRSRLNIGWSVEKALITPVKRYKKRK